MKNKKTRLVWEYFSGEIKNIFPYFIAFYLVSLLLARFSAVYQSFFYWPAFNGSAILLVLIYFISLSANWRPKIKFKKFSFKFVDFKLFLKNVKSGYKKITISLREYLIAHWPHNPIWFFARVIIIVVVLGLALKQSITLPDFLMLSYALVAVLFALDSRYAAGAALICLVACPILLVAKKDGSAESFAVYAYYFLVVAIIGAILESKLKKR